MTEEKKEEPKEAPAKPWRFIDNYDKNGKPAGALGYVGFVNTVDRYVKLRGKLYHALYDAYKKFADDYRLKYGSLPMFSQVRERAQGAMSDFLANIPSPAPQSLPDMLDEI